MDSIPAGYDKGPSGVILQRICEFSNFTAGSNSLLAEQLQSSVAEPWFGFILKNYGENCGERGNSEKKD